MMLARDLTSLAYILNRKAMPRLFSGRMPYYVVNEYPKSGGGWIAQMLSAALGLPFPRHRPLGLQPAVAHGHFLNATGLRNVLLVWRDPRDVAVSYYFHCYFVNEFHNREFVMRMKERLPFDDYTDVRANLPRFLHFVNETPLSPGFTWARFARQWAARPQVTHIRYEDARTDCAGELARVVRSLTGRTLPAREAAAVSDAYAFERAKARAEKDVRRRGAELSFVREGSVGGWRRHFTPEAEELADRYFAEAARPLGYW